MSAQELLDSARALLDTFVAGQNAPEEDRLDVWIAATNLPHAVRALQNAGWGYLSAVTGLDFGPEAGQMEALYHFCNGPAVLTLRVRLGRATPSVPSLCPIIPSAGFFERELSEMFGITVEGAPNTDHLYLPDDWPDGVYPLRKDFDPATLQISG